MNKLIQRLVMGVVLTGMLTALAGTAMADRNNWRNDDQRWRHQERRWEHREWRRSDWNRNYPSVYVAPGRVYYPPAVVYAPPPVHPGIQFYFGF